MPGPAGMSPIRGRRGPVVQSEIWLRDLNGYVLLGSGESRGGGIVDWVVAGALMVFIVVTLVVLKRRDRRGQ